MTFRDYSVAARIVLCILLICLLCSFTVKGDSINDIHVLRQRLIRDSPPQPSVSNADNLWMLSFQDSDYYCVHYEFYPCFMSQCCITIMRDYGRCRLMIEIDEFVDELDDEDWIELYLTKKQYEKFLKEFNNAISSDQFDDGGVYLDGIGGTITYSDKVWEQENQEVTAIINGTDVLEWKTESKGMFTFGNSTIEKGRDYKAIKALFKLLDQFEYDEKSTKYFQSLKTMLK